MTSARNASSLLALAPLAAGMLLAVLLLQLAFAGRSTNFEEAALDDRTVSFFARHEGLPVHCEDVSNAEGCLAGQNARGATRAALWLGNSQLHAINQPRAGDETAAPILFRKLRDAGLDLLTFSQPNASLQEHYVLFEYLRARMPLERLVIAVVFDDLRETGLRAEIGMALSDAPTAEALAATALGRRLLETQVVTDSDLAGVARTPQEHSERALNGWLTEHSRLWSLRAEARGSLFLGLYRLRNAVLGITPQTKRRRVPGRYRDNMLALDTLLDRARDADVRSLVYVVPLRNDIETPYVAEDYAAFKHDVEQRVLAAGARFADLESLVPAEIWGSKVADATGGRAELDFMHFQGPGHRLLADALYDLLVTDDAAGPR